MKWRQGLFEIVPACLLATLAGRQVGAEAREPGAPVTDTLRAVVRDMTTGGSIGGVRVFLVVNPSDTTWGRASSSSRAITDDHGEFVLPQVPRGTLVLRLEYPGYPVQEDTIQVGDTTESYRVFPLRFSGVCVGFCLPSPSLVAANRARRKDWGCELADPESIEAERQAWVESLTTQESPDWVSSWDSLLGADGVPRNPAQVGRRLRHVTNHEVCRRAGEAYDSAVPATRSDFLAFRIGGLLIATESWHGRATVVLNRNYEVLVTFIDD